VEVKATAPILQTETPEVSQVFDHSKIIGLPLNSRDVVGTLGVLTAGVAPARRTIGGRRGDRGRGALQNVRGLRQQDNIVLVDGTIMTEGNGQLTFLPDPDAVQEFEIKTTLYGAEYGVRPGGQVSLVTKSGTNQPHGTGYWLHRNDNLDARNFFDQGPRPEYKRNQFGTTFGGPIHFPGLFNGRDRAWFFFSYSGERVRRFRSLTGNVPTEDQRQGRFTTAVTDPLTGAAFPNNTIPQSRFNPVSLKFMEFWPKANTPPERGFNFTSNSSDPLDRNGVITSIDLRTSANSRWQGRFIFDSQPTNLNTAIDVFRAKHGLRTWSQNIRNVRSIGARAVNEFGVHFFRRPYNPGAGRSSSPDDFASTLGIPNFPSRTVDRIGVPNVAVTSLLLVGDNGTRGFVNIGNWEVRDSFSFVKGSHSLKAGYHFRRHYNLFATENRSSFSFSPDRYTRNAFGNFLLGYLTTSTLGAEGLRGNFAQNSHYFYLQDNWKTTDRLTLSLGLRYELRLPWKDKRGLMSNVDPRCACYNPPLVIADPPPGLTGRFTAGAPLIEWTKNGWQPRVGFAYRADPKTVVRSGFGIYANEPYINMVQLIASNPRPGTSALSFTSDPNILGLTFSNPFDLSARVPGGGLPNVSGFETPLPQASLYGWGLTLQRELAAGMVFEIGYEGGHAVHDIQLTQFNDAVPGTGSRQARRPYPQYQNWQVVTADGDNRFNSMVLRLEKRADERGFQFLVSYTLAKTLDTTGGRAEVPGDPTGVTRNLPLSLNRGRGEGDIPGRFVAVTGYELPFGQGKPHLTGGPWGRLLGGWSLFSILELQKGAWLTPVLAVDNLDVGSGVGQRPDLTGNPNLDPSQRTPNRWFDTSAFALPPRTRFGTAGRSIIEGPGMIELDVSVRRTFRLSEAVRMDFRFDVFNLPNHTNFYIPGNSFGTAGFGVIGAALEPRDLQMGFKFYF
jgi:hypothetical protein